MAVTLYSVVRIGFQYDDQYYSWPQRGGGETETAFKDELRAYKYAHELNRNAAQAQEYEGITEFYDVRSFTVNEEDVTNG